MMMMMMMTMMIIIPTITTTLMMMMMMMMIMALNGDIDVFYNILAVLPTASNMHAQMARVQSCTNHVQHIECLSRAV